VFVDETEGTMRADRIDVSWDTEKSAWLVRIISGEEVIRRHCNFPQNADDQTLTSAAEKTAKDEGYEGGTVNIRR
jgi:hypothetical protein